jgi:hypothetical protein
MKRGVTQTRYCIVWSVIDTVKEARSNMNPDNVAWSCLNPVKEARSNMNPDNVAWSSLNPVREAKHGII